MGDVVVAGCRILSAKQSSSPSSMSEPVDVGISHLKVSLFLVILVIHFF